MTAIDATTRAHAVQAPSSAFRRRLCLGSAALEMGQPDNSNVHSRWGTAAHELASLVLAPVADGKATFDDVNAEGFIGRNIAVEGEDIEVDMEMATCVNDYVNHIATFVDLAAGDTLMIEQQVPIEHLTGEAGATGTSDVIAFCNKNTELCIIDLKGGRGVRVFASYETQDAAGGDVERPNEQMAEYASGSLYEHEMLYDFKTVRVVISQPRLDHLDDFLMTIDEFREAENELREVESKARSLIERHNGAEWMLETGMLTAGEKQCRFCKVAGSCPALRGEAVGSIRKTIPAEAGDFPDLSVPKLVAKAADADQLSALDVEVLAEAMRSADLVEIWLKAVRAAVETRLFADKPVPGYKLVEGKRGNRGWRDAAEAESEMKKARLKSEEMYNRSVISVSVAEKLLKPKPKVWAKLAPLITQSDGKPSVAPESDPRPPITVGAAAEEFPDMDIDPANDPLFA